MQQSHQSKTRLLDATIKVVRTKGYNATRVEDVCAEAGVTKGSFFHHFKSKDDLALAALERWKESSTAFFANAPYHHHHAPNPQKQAEMISKKLNLSADQTAKLTPIFADRDRSSRRSCRTSPSPRTSVTHR